VSNDTQAMAVWRASLRAAGYEIDAALSGDEARERAVSGRPDAVVVGPLESDTDIFLRQMRQDPGTAAIPVVVIGPRGEAAVLDALRAALTPRRVLVAEDDRQMSAILCMLLEKNGYAVRAAYDGVETLREVKAWKPDLLVLDVMLPIVDGFHVCQSINEDPTLETAPRVIIVSGRASDWDQQLGAVCGAEHYLVKPFSNDFFLRKVREIMADDTKPAE
jgi:DNA-binding response OmpR family regulator